MTGNLAESRAQARAALAQLERHKRRELTVSPEFFDLDFEALALRADDGVQLSAWFVEPTHRDGPSATAVLMHHHYGGQKAAMLPWIELLCGLGLPCMAFDARGHAGSPCTPEQQTYIDRFADVRAAFEALQRRGFDRVLLYGQSQGAAVLVGGLAGQPAVRGAILDSGPAPAALPSIVGLARTLVPADAPPLSGPLMAWGLWRRVKPRRYIPNLWRGLWLLRDRPLLWLHGTADRVIPPAWPAVWFSLLGPLAPRWRALRVDGAAHVECLQTDAAAVRDEVVRVLEEL